MARKGSSLTDRQRRLLVAAGLVETVLKALMLIDLRRRSPDEVRGPKWAWAAGALINTAGVGAVAYFVVGRRPHSEGAPPSP